MTRRVSFLLDAPLIIGIIGVFLSFAACSGPSQSSSGQERSGPSPEPSPGDRGARASVAKYETFDASKYPVRLPETETELTHEVPARLMDNRADEGVTRTVEGFRLQVFSAQDQKAAEEFREKVRSWWQSVQDEAPQDLFSQDPPIVIEYSQPYYRVRFGAFADRQKAEKALKFVQKKYPGAFLARGSVTVTM